MAHSGPLSQLRAIEGAPLRYIFELREQGVMVNMLMVALRTSFILPELREKSFTMRCTCVKRFLIAHTFSYRMGTHTLQHPPAKVESKAFDFMQFMCLIVSGGNHNQNFVINMDQTLVYFTTNAKQMLKDIGKKTIHICTSTNDMKRVTMAVTIMADNTLLPSTLVFKRTPHGCIGTKEFPSGSYPTTHIYKYQEAAWMDEQVMITWVNKVLASYITTAPDHAVPFLILATCTDAT